MKVNLTLSLFIAGILFYQGYTKVEFSKNNYKELLNTVQSDNNRQHKSKSELPFSIKGRPAEHTNRTDNDLSASSKKSSKKKIYATSSVEKNGVFQDKTSLKETKTKTDNSFKAKKHIQTNNLRDKPENEVSTSAYWELATQEETETPLTSYTKEISLDEITGISSLAYLQETTSLKTTDASPILHYKEENVRYSYSEKPKTQGIVVTPMSDSKETSIHINTVKYPVSYSETDTETLNLSYSEENTAEESTFTPTKTYANDTLKSEETIAKEHSKGVTKPETIETSKLQYSTEISLSEAIETIPYTYTTNSITDEFTGVPPVPYTTNLTTDEITDNQLPSSYTTASNNTVTPVLFHPKYVTNKTSSHSKNTTVEKLAINYISSENQSISAATERTSFSFLKKTGEQSTTSSDLNETTGEDATLSIFQRATGATASLGFERTISPETTRHLQYATPVITTIRNGSEPLLCIFVGVPVTHLKPFGHAIVVLAFLVIHFLTFLTYELSGVVCGYFKKRRVPSATPIVLLTACTLIILVIACTVYLCTGVKVKILTDFV